MNFEKPDPQMVEYFDTVAPGPEAGVEKRQMFGYPCRFVNGNMFMGLHNKNMIIRLSDKERDAFSKLGGKGFEPMPGRAMKEYMVVPANMLGSKDLKSWIDKSLAYAANLPVKKKVKKKSK